MIDTPVHDLSTATYTFPTDAPEADGTLAWDSTTMVVVRAAAGNSVGTGWTYGPAACASVVSGMLADEVRGQCFLDIPGCHARMVRAVRNAGRAGIAACAISAVDVALWDLEARMLDLPLHRLLGTARDAVPVYGSGGFTSYDEHQLTEQLEHWVAKQSIPRVKIKIGESFGTDVERDLARIGQAREVIGPDVELYVDANGAYGRKQAVRVLDRAADFDVRWFEEPVSSDDLTGMRQVRDAVSADVAAGEYGYTPDYFERMCAAGAVDCLQADASRCGGISGFRHAAAIAAAHNLQISGHCAPNLHAHVAAATVNFRHLEWFHDHVRIESQCFDGALDPTGGAICPDPDAPGHGLTLREPDIAEFRTQ